MSTESSDQSSGSGPAHTRSATARSDPPPAAPALVLEDWPGQAAPATVHGSGRMIATGGLSPIARRSLEASLTQPKARSKNIMCGIHRAAGRARPFVPAARPSSSLMRQPAEVATSTRGDGAEQARGYESRRRTGRAEPAGDGRFVVKGKNSKNNAGGALKQEGAEAKTDAHNTTREATERYQKDPKRGVAGGGKVVPLAQMSSAPKIVLLLSVVCVTMYACLMHFRGVDYRDTHTVLSSADADGLGDSVSERHRLQAERTKSTLLFGLVAVVALIFGLLNSTEAAEA